MGLVLKLLYRIFLMPYLERDRYYKELVDDVYENDIPKILNEMGYEKPFDQQHGSY